MKRQWLALLVAFLVGVGLFLVTSTILDDGGDSPPAPPAPAPLPADAPRGDLQGDPDLLRNTLPPGVDRDRARELLEDVERQVEEAPAPRPRPTGGAQNYTFRTAYSGTPRGTGGTRLQVVIHCTVGQNRPGWDDVYGTKNYLDRVGLSATWIVDFEGHFLKTMTADHYAYTQGPGFNRYSLSLEIVSTCRESRAQWLASPLIKDGLLSSWLADRLREIGAPFRRVDPQGCNPGRGYTDHAALECGNDHTDISFSCARFDPRSWAAPPCAFPWSLLARQLADGPDAPNRKLAKWKRSHRIAHAKLRRPGCSGNSYCGRRYRSRNRKLHRLIVREGGTL
jgi:hypothetical protein